jgi:hypothetical protein
LPSGADHASKRRRASKRRGRWLVVQNLRTLRRKPSISSLRSIDINLEPAQAGRTDGQRGAVTRAALVCDAAPDPPLCRSHRDGFGSVSPAAGPSVGVSRGNRLQKALLAARLLPRLKFTLVAPEEGNRYLYLRRQAKSYHDRLQRDDLHEWPERLQHARPEIARHRLPDFRCG